MEKCKRNRPGNNIGGSSMSKQPKNDDHQEYMQRGDCQEYVQQRQMPAKKLYKCHHCNKTFFKKYVYECHEKIDSQNKQIKGHFPENTEMRNIVETSHMEVTFNSVEVVAQKLFDNDMNEQYAAAEFMKCAICDAVYSTYYGLIKHSRLHTEGLYGESSSMSDVRNTKPHTSHQTETRLYACMGCNMTFSVSQLNIMVDHVSLHHTNHNPKLKQVRPLVTIGIKKVSGFMALDQNQSDSETQRNLSETQVSLCETQGSHSKTQGSPSETHRNHSETQVHPYETQGSHCETRGSPCETQGRHCEPRGSHSETQGSYSDTLGSHSESLVGHSETQGSHSETQGNHSETLGSHSEIQGSHPDPPVGHSEHMGSYSETQESHSEDLVCSIVSKCELANDAGHAEGDHIRHNAVFTTGSIYTCNSLRNMPETAGCQNSPISRYNFFDDILLIYSDTNYMSEELCDVLTEQNSYKLDIKRKFQYKDYDNVHEMFKMSVNYPTAPVSTRGLYEDISDVESEPTFIAEYEDITDSEAGDEVDYETQLAFNSLETGDQHQDNVHNSNSDLRSGINAEDQMQSTSSDDLDGDLGGDPCGDPGGDPGFDPGGDLVGDPGGDQGFDPGGD